MTALLTLLLGVMAVLAPGGADRPVLRRRAAPELVTAQIVVLVVGALLGALVLGLPWWQTAAAILLAGLWSVLARLVVGPRASLGCWGAALAVVALCAALQDEPQAAARRAADLCQGAGCLLLLTTPANRLVIDLLAVARGRARASTPRRRTVTPLCAEGAGSGPWSGSFCSCSPPRARTTPPSRRSSPPRASSASPRSAGTKGEARPRSSSSAPSPRGLSPFWPLRS